MQRVRGIGESKMHDLFYKQRIPEIVNAHPAIIFFLLLYVRGVIKKLSALYALVRFILLKSLLVGHLN